jgi:hypothetical protein
MSSSHWPSVRIEHCAGRVANGALSYGRNGAGESYDNKNCDG